MAVVAMDQVQEIGTRRIQPHATSHKPMFKITVHDLMMLLQVWVKMAEHTSPPMIKMKIE